MTFQWFVPQVEYSRPWKVLRESGVLLLSILPKSSFGEHRSPCSDVMCSAVGNSPNCLNESPFQTFTEILCSPNEDVGRMNTRSDKHFRVRFRSTFQRCVAKIEYSCPWKVLRVNLDACAFTWKWFKACLTYRKYLQTVVRLKQKWPPILSKTNQTTRWKQEKL